jgi:glycine/D-amino acid oxidase-like deaminating enzyme
MEFADIVVIGQGIVGAAVAHHLTRLGARDVLVIEAEPIPGSGSTGASAGGLRQQFAEACEIAYATEGVRQIANLEADTGRDAEVRRTGYLLLASERATAARLRAEAELQRSCGLEIEELDPFDIASRFPLIRTLDLILGNYCPTDGQCDPNAVLQGFLGAARERGARLSENVEATEISMVDGRVTGVKTTAGAIAAGTVVIAAGARAGELAATAGITLPLTPCRRQIFQSTPLPLMPLDVPLTIDHDGSFYFRPESGGAILSAMEVEPTDTLDTSVDRGVLPELALRAAHRVPMLEEAGIQSGWCGLRTLTPDDRAILGPVPGVEGLMLAVGLGGHGITHGPAVGLAVAEWVMYEEVRSLPSDPYRLDRFLS